MEPCIKYTFGTLFFLLIGATLVDIAGIVASFSYRPGNQIPGTTMKFTARIITFARIALGVDLALILVYYLMIYGLFQSIKEKNMKKIRNYLYGFVIGYICQLGFACYVHFKVRPVPYFYIIVAAYTLVFVGFVYYISAFKNLIEKAVKLSCDHNYLFGKNVDTAPHQYMIGYEITTEKVLELN